MEKVVRKVSFEESERLEYWLSKTPQEKLEALTRMRVTSHGGERIKKAFRKVRHDR